MVKSDPRHLRGITLIELMVVVAILAILASLAGPSFGDLIDRRRLASQTEAVTDLLHLARSEALKHSGAVLPRSVAVTVSPGAPWFVGLSNGETACAGATCVLNEGGESVPRLVNNTACAACTMVAPSGVGLIVFSFRGQVETSSDSSQIEFQSPRGNRTRVTLSRIGRVSVCSVTGMTSSYPACT